MRVEIKIDADCGETKVIVVTEKISDEINELVKRISEHVPAVLVGFSGEGASVLEHGKIFRFFSANRKVYAVTDAGEFTVKPRLHELEQRLPPSEFVRISNSEIINLKKIKNFDLSFTGTICVKFLDGSVSYVSRRYVSKIKRILGM